MTSNYNETISVRVTTEQKAQLGLEAATAGMKIGDYYRAKLTDATSTPTSPTALHTRLASVETAMASLDGGSDALAAAQRAAELIHREDDK